MADPADGAMLVFRGPTPETAEAFFRMVEQTEQIELRELFDFCRDVAHSSYIF